MRVALGSLAHSRPHSIGSSFEGLLGVPRRQTCFCKHRVCFIFKDLGRKWPSCPHWSWAADLGVAGEYGFDLGIEPLGPLILRDPSALSGHSQAAQRPSGGSRNAASIVPTLVLGGRLSLVSSRYLAMPDTWSSSFQSPISLGAFWVLWPHLYGSTCVCDHVPGPGAGRQVL